METRSKICLVPRLSGIGGMVSFQGKFAAGLRARNIDICFDLSETPYDAVLVIGGTRQIHRLWQVKRSGIRVIQRLDGMNWIHRVLRTGWRHWLRAEYGNFMLSLIRSSFADKIVYQSKFSRQWWERVKGDTACPNYVIYNAVDLNEFSPGDAATLPKNSIRLLLVEGSLLGGYEFGLQNAVYLASELAHSHDGDRHLELIVVGRVSRVIRDHWNSWLSRAGLNGLITIQWVGIVPHSHIADTYRNSHLLFSADINAACPNSVIEAMACGTPVLSFDTGALAELLENKGGIVVPYGRNPWELDPPDIKSLTKGAIKVLENIDRYQVSAREQAKAEFDVEVMVDQYLDLLVG